MQLSDSHKFMFFHPACKTGGTSVAVALSQVSDDPFGDRHLRPSHAREWIPDKFHHYFKFAFVRNPWDRMVSCYAYDNMVTKAFQVGGEFHGITFADYLDLRLVRQRGYWSSPQVDFLKDKGAWLVDFTGRFERLQDDFDVVCDRVGIGKIMLPTKRKTNHGHYREYYTTESSMLVHNVFARDIEEFGYDF